MVQIQYCKRLIEIGDRESEASVWGEINSLRWAAKSFQIFTEECLFFDWLDSLAMLEYGALSPIGGIFVF